MSQNQVYMKILKSPIDFKPFLKLDYTRRARVALRAFVRSRLNLFAHVNLTCLKYSQVENVDFCVVLPRTYGSNKTQFRIFVHT